MGQLKTQSMSDHKIFSIQNMDEIPVSSAEAKSFLSIGAEEYQKIVESGALRKSIHSEYRKESDFSFHSLTDLAAYISTREISKDLLEWGVAAEFVEDSISFWESVFGYDLDHNVNPNPCLAVNILAQNPHYGMDTLSQVDIIVLESIAKSSAWGLENIAS